MMISILMGGYPLEKEYIELPLCAERLKSHLTYATKSQSIEYIGFKDGKGRLNEILRNMPLTGQSLPELNLLAYVLTRFCPVNFQNGLVNDSYTLSELINTAYADHRPPQHYTEANLLQQLQYERSQYGLCIDVSQPQEYPGLRISEMDEGILYWTRGIDQYSDFQAFIRQGKDLIHCPAWINIDKSIRFNESMCDKTIIYTLLDLPAPDTTLSDADDLLRKIFIDFAEDELSANIRYEQMESALLPEKFAQSIWEVPQIGGIQ